MKSLSQKINESLNESANDKSIGKFNNKTWPAAKTATRNKFIDDNGLSSKYYSSNWNDVYDAIKSKKNESLNEDKKVPTSFLASKLIYFSRIMKSSGVKKRNAIYQYLVDSLALDTEEANTLSELLVTAESSDKDEVTKLLDKWKIDTSVIKELGAIKESLENIDESSKEFQDSMNRLAEYIKDTVEEEIDDNPDFKNDTKLKKYIKDYFSDEDDFCHLPVAANAAKLLDFVRTGKKQSWTGDFTDESLNEGKESKEFKEGFKAFQRTNKKLNDNPYEKDSTEFEEWSKGWSRAQDEAANDHDEKNKNNNESLDENETSINEGKTLKVGNYVSYYTKKHEDTGGKILSIDKKEKTCSIKNWDGSTDEMKLSDVIYIDSWNNTI